MKSPLDGKTIAILTLIASSPGVAVVSQEPPEPATYRTVGERALKAYVFEPAAASASRPAILLFHGGGWQVGEPEWVFRRARGFAEKGLVAIAVEYRLSHDGLSPIDAVEDACAAFAWARANAASYGIDAKHVAGYGVSAGGHLVAAAGTLPSVRGRKLKAVERPDAMLLYSPALDTVRDAHFGGLMQGKGKAADYSPAEYVTRALPPTLIIQGAEDTVVPTRSAQAFCQAAKQARASCTLQVYPKVGHLLTRNLKFQYDDFDPDPALRADAHSREVAFLVSLGYAR